MTGEGERLVDAALLLNSEGDGVQHHLQPFAFGTQLSGLVSWVFGTLQHYRLLQVSGKT